MVNKRKVDQIEDSESPVEAKRRDIGQRDQFREGLFDQEILDVHTRSYKESKPYHYGVIQNPIKPELLRKVRSEIQDLSFTPKETDIYKIHQSGDLANLDGLNDSSLKLLPSLLILRDALYSSYFREYLSFITKSGPLSGKKTDMAVNVYTPGCHLLCHDDVIGSRRVSYILYLTDPDRPWEQEWGGALRLYPTQSKTEDDGSITKVPSPDHSVSIPPAFNQLSFFAVQPGESFHDVEEVYGETDATDKGKDERRVRMAISGWYHIPQEGEDGYKEGLEEQFVEKSSLVQLQGKADQYDLPKANIKSYSAPEAEGGLPTPSSQDDLPLSSQDIDFLLKYIAPTYLTPDPLKEVSEIFAEECSILLDTFLSSKFSTALQDYVKTQESQPLPPETLEIEKTTPWKVARPPHKHRFLFQQDVASESELSPIEDVLQNLFPSKPFQKWLAIATGYQVTSHDCLIRRFRRGKDYTLATGYEEDSSRIELCLSLTPIPDRSNDPPKEPETQTGDVMTGNSTPQDAATADDAGSGGYLAYIAGDDEDDDDDAGSDHGVEVPPDLSTGARSTKSTNPNPKKPKSDPAIYTSSADNDDDGVLFHMPPDWNRLGIVLRDKGTMRFVKYVSRMARGDRWDVVGEFEVVDEGGDGDGDEGGDGDGEEGGEGDAVIGAVESEDEDTEIEDEDYEDDSDD